MGSEFIVVFDGSIQYSVPTSHLETIRTVLDSLCRSAKRISPPLPETVCSNTECKNPICAEVGAPEGETCNDEDWDH